MKYRAEIDGLRALAVIPVIFFHAGFELFSGGFVGVDVFFVISGYLITTILIEDIENQRFSIVNFYERRARRILPALFFMMLCCIPLAWMWMPATQMKDFMQSLIAVSFFVSNILFWKESGYFEVAAEEKPLLHTWSLAVEEQYYILFPIFLFLAWRFGKNRVFWLITFFTAISLILAEWGWRNKPEANFYILPTRAWELFAGSITAFIIQKRGVQASNIFSLIGLAGIIVAIFIYDETTPFPSIYTILPVMGVSLLVLYSDGKTFIAKLLGVKLFVGIGLISYSAYLWHQPLFAFARIRSLREPSGALMVLLSIISILLAYLSWKFVEGPFRNKTKFTRKTIFLISSVFTLFFILFGAFGQLHVGKAGKLNPYNVSIDYLNYSADNKALQNSSWENLKAIANDRSYFISKNAFDQESWFNLSDQREKVLVVGNSHSKDLFNVLLKSKRFALNYQIARYGVPIGDLEQKHIFFNSPNFLASDIVVIATKYDDHDLENIDQLIQLLNQFNKKTVLVKSIFEFDMFRGGKWSLIDKLVFEAYTNDLLDDKLPIRINKKYYEEYAGGHTSEHVKTVNKKLQLLAERFSNVTLLDRMDYVCEQSAQTCFAVSNTLDKHFYDYGHHTLDGADFFGKRVDDVSWFDLTK